MSVSPSDAAFIRDLVMRKSAIVLDAAKDYLIESRLEGLSRQLGYARIDDLVHHARRGSTSMETQIVEAITTHETSFFRDVQPFEIFARDILPPLIEARRQSRVLTIWSAACSSGQEPYSIVMKLLDLFPSLNDWVVTVVATDISTQILDKARAARFGQLEVNRGLPAAYLVRFFERKGLDWHLRDEVRRRVDFRQMNLVEPWFMQPRPDVVFLRNVLIYFDVATKRTVLDRMRRNLAPDGALLLGAAETTFNVTDDWKAVSGTRGIYYRPVT